MEEKAEIAVRTSNSSWTITIIAILLAMIVGGFIGWKLKPAGVIIKDNHIVRIDTLIPDTIIQKGDLIKVPKIVYVTTVDHISTIDTTFVVVDTNYTNIDSILQEYYTVREYKYESMYDSGYTVVDSIVISQNRIKDLHQRILRSDTIPVLTINKARLFTANLGGVYSTFDGTVSPMLSVITPKHYTISVSKPFHLKGATKWENWNVGISFPVLKLNIK